MGLPFGIGACADGVKERCVAAARGAAFGFLVCCAVHFPEVSAQNSHFKRASRLLRNLGFLREFGVVLCLEFGVLMPERKPLLEAAFGLAFFFFLSSSEVVGTLI